MQKRFQILTQCAGALTGHGDSADIPIETGGCLVVLKRLHLLLLIEGREILRSQPDQQQPQELQIVYFDP